MHFPLLEPLTPTAEPWGGTKSEEHRLNVFYAS